MIFSTNIFVFVFLPSFLAIYYLVPARLRSLVILAGSYVFYGWWRVEYLLLIFLMSLVSYFAAHITVKSSVEAVRKWALRIGVCVDLIALGYFKYTFFLMSSADGVLQFFGGDGIDAIKILLPIGISFHTFQSISYIVDVYRRDAEPARTVVDFLAFGALFPQLIAGPVLRYKDLSEQFVSRTHSLEKFTRGVYRFILGLSMKVLIADSVAPLADRIFALNDPSFLESWVGALAYTVQLFFDFAGYSAMAIGLGLMVGFEFIENFNAPYISRSITEFWKRWHISLSAWLRDYLYVPLGGNRKGPTRTYINLMLTMVLGGLWHGANWTFIVWGIWHGGIMAIERALGSKKQSSVYPSFLALPITFTMVVIGWVVFRASDISAALNMYKGMFGFNSFAIRDSISWAILPSEMIFMCVGLAICFAPLVKIGELRLPPFVQAAGYTGLCFIALSKMSSQTFSPFLYFQF